MCPAIHSPSSRTSSTVVASGMSVGTPATSTSRIGSLMRPSLPRPSYAGRSGARQTPTSPGGFAWLYQAPEWLTRQTPALAGSSGVSAGSGRSGARRPRCRAPRWTGRAPRPGPATAWPAPRRPSSPRRRTPAAAAARRPRSPRCVVCGTPTRSSAGAVRSTTSTRWAPTVARQARAACRRRRVGRGRRPGRGRRVARCRPCRGWSAAASCRGSLARAIRNSRSRAFDEHVEPDRRLVEDQQRGECSSAAAISARIRWPSESCRTGVSSVSPISSCSTSSAVRATSLPRIELVDRGQDREGLAQRQVPPQLRALAEDHADAPREVAALRRPAPARTCGPTRTSAPGCPQSILIVVDLPAPFAPM